MLKMILAFTSRKVTRTCLAFVCVMSAPVHSHELPLDKLVLPEGFTIDVFADVLNPRQLAMSTNGTVYVGSRRAGMLHALVDADSDGVAEDVIEIDTDLNLPSGIAWRDGDLYVGAVNQILVYRDIDTNFRNSPEPELLTDALPTERHHGWKYLAFGPDGMLYFNVGAPCNICLKDNPWYSTIMRTDVTKRPLQFEIYAHGVRNSVGFTWHPETRQLWFTDNGRDHLGDELPPCELNVAEHQHQHFGFPYLHGSNVVDPEFGEQTPDNMDFVEPALELGAHVAPLGLIFYTGKQFPERYRNNILIAEHGSWNRSEEAGHVGFRVMRVTDPGDGPLTYEPFIEGWLDGGNRWGRPDDLIVMPDGSLLISDDKANTVYRVSYSPPQVP